jgi:UDP-N-acetylglucosamine/UDP-N-acetylgalactosamine diphosphorylase
MNATESGLRARAEAAGQGHLFAHWTRLDAAQRARLQAQLAEVDFDLVQQLAAQIGAPALDPAGCRFEPPDLFRLRRDAAQMREAERARELGYESLAQGTVGFLLVAGGQASRLGYEGPKGDYPVGPVSGRTLFGWHGARILAAARRYGFRPLWLIMTSAANDAATRASFARHGYFGFDPADVVFFRQAMLPALDLQGRILLASPDSLFLAPNGHGGTLDALARSGALAQARERGLETLSYFQVDNPLARPADPLFVGLHRAAGARMSSKVVAKREAGEKVGVLGRLDGTLGCIEYSDLPHELREARDSQGELLFGAGNIAVHLIDVDFVAELTAEGLELPWHVARKRMATIDEQGQPCEVEGVKFETFVFDALARSGPSVTLEVERALEFSPVKNREGDDSPHSCRRDLGQLFAGWVERGGGPPPPLSADGVPAVEVDPLLAEDVDQFVAGGPPAPRTAAGGHLYAAPEERS